MKDFLILISVILTNSIGFSQSFNSNKMDSLFQQLDEHNKFMGTIVVSQNGNVLYSRSAGYSDLQTSKRADIDTRYRIGSISKMFTASLVLKAIEENRLQLNQTLNKYFPAIENSKKITIEYLLNHKSGIHDFTNDKGYSAYNTGAKSEVDMIQLIGSSKSDFQPGSAVKYSNSNYIILSYILEKIYNKPYETILNSKIVRPLGLRHTYYGGKINIRNGESYSYHFIDKWSKGNETDPSIPMGAGAIVSTPTDLTTFIEDLFSGKIISQKSLSIMKTMNRYHGIGVGAGMLMFTHLKKESYGHNGAIDDFKSLLNYFPEEKLSVALTSNGSIYPIDSVLACALSCQFNEPFKLPIFNYKMAHPEMLSLYVGQYTAQQVPLTLAITKNENKIFGQVKGQPVFPLEAIGENIFKFEQAGLTLEFNINNKQMTLKQGGQEILLVKE